MKRILVFLIILSPIVSVAQQNSRDSIKSAIRQFIGQQTSEMSEEGWTNLSKQLQKTFPKVQFTEQLLIYKMDYYADKRNWLPCTQAAYQLMQQFGENIGHRDINNISWDNIFLHSSDSAILLESSKWMRRSIDKDTNRVISVDTYANLLYKLGRKEEAIAWENKAIERGTKINADARDMKDFRDNLEKMTKGIPTWPVPNSQAVTK